MMRHPETMQSVCERAAADRTLACARRLHMITDRTPVQQAAYEDAVGALKRQRRMARALRAPTHTPTLRVRIAPATWTNVSTLAEASRAVRSYLDNEGLGFSGWRQESAPVTNAANKVIARVSYNGRVWTPQRKWTDRTEITGAALEAVAS